ncbi:cytochrome c oxidase assembly protein subunit 15 [Virgibacillus natechei]|uniref:Heme A synthase n=1 Tax=Virgibacillus natechei TaxID=1216297 RepID=A0ABS4IDX5_9BACI|nr:heme A synthase [Virgibacillus natechei]MBP1968229.1 cytochrome c oxidase assembly protein subunit 15 [Virgibacillus natechei]UZD14500.1 heme A synthase [Virgibacillus natechei]
MIKILKWLSVVSTIGMAFILMGGALVTKTDSQDGCGDSWPLCEGQFLPTVISPELVIELSHRLVTGIVGFTVLALAILAWKYIGHVREVKFLAFISVFFLVLQALIGAAAVMWSQSDFVLAAHFGISLISFASVFLLMLLVFEIDKKFDTKSLFIQKKHRLEIYAITIFTMFVVYTGALVRHTEANLVCGDWPFCSNAAPLAFADYSLEQWIQMGHRLAAAILFIWTIILFVKMMKNYRHHRVMYWSWIISLGLIFSQVFFGAMIIFTLLNLGIALLHAFVISCFFAMLSYFILLATRSAKDEKENRNTENDTSSFNN